MSDDHTEMHDVRDVHEDEAPTEPLVDSDMERESEPVASPSEPVEDVPPEAASEAHEPEEESDAELDPAAEEAVAEDGIAPDAVESLPASENVEATGSWQETVHDVVTRSEEALAGAAAGAAAAVINATTKTKTALDTATESTSTLPMNDTPRPRGAVQAPMPDNFALRCFASVLIGVIVLLFLRRLLGGGSRKRRDKTVLVGLPSSGKTALFAQLTTGHTTESRTSTMVNSGVLRLADGHVANGSGTAIIDFPGHRRMRSLLYAYLEEATNVVVTVDAVTIHDDQHEGALAVAGLLLNVMESPAFYGVRRLAIAATKRDELTSYSIKAVRKLLEAAMVRTIVARQGELNRVDKVIDVKGGVVTAGKQRHGAGKKAYVVDVNENGGFSFDQLGLEEVTFVEISSLASSSSSPGQMSVEPIRSFILHK